MDTWYQIKEREKKTKKNGYKVVLMHNGKKKEKKKRKKNGYKVVLMHNGKYQCNGI